VRKIQENALTALKPGIPVKKVYAVAKRTAEEEGYGKYFMTRAVYDVEYLGHGVGLEIDEPPLVGPRTNLLMQEGMVFAFEPKIIIPGWGGVDIEDTLTVAAGGVEVLTRTDRKLWVV
jgi:Xaa-Pro aminopeptidase